MIHPRVCEYICTRFPGALMVDSEEELKRKVEDSLAPGILRGQTEGAEACATGPAEFSPGSVIARGTFDDIQEYFYRQPGTDGLPVIPPTAAVSTRSCASPTATPVK